MNFSQGVSLGAYLSGAYLVGAYLSGGSLRLPVCLRWILGHAGRKGKGEDRSVYRAAHVAAGHDHHTVMLPQSPRAGEPHSVACILMIVPYGFFSEVRRGAFTADAPVFSEGSNIRYSFGAEGLPGNMGDDF